MKYVPMMFYSRRLKRDSFLLILLCLIWNAGLFYGLHFSECFADALDSFFVQAPDTPVSFFGALSVNVFPLLISACAVFLFRSVAFIFCFFRAVLFGLGLGLIARCYLGAGLLMSGLLMFSWISFAPVLFWYWCRRLELGSRHFQKDTIKCLLIGLAIAGMDVWIVSPFVRDVMNF